MPAAFYPISIEDIHLSVSSEGAYGAVATLNFTLVNKGFRPATYRVEIVFKDISGEIDRKSLVGVLFAKKSKPVTIDIYMHVVEATINLYRVFGLRPLESVTVTPT